MSSERRRVTRYPFIASAKIIHVRTEAALRARTSELSRYGCYLDMMNPFPLGTAIRLEIEHGGKMFQAEGTVVYSQINMGMGVSFTAIAEEQAEILESWLSSVEQHHF